MSGILANSVSRVMLDAESAADNAVSGFIRGETITLSATGTNESFVWGISKPGGAGARSDLSRFDGASPSFTPDAPGYYVLTVVLNGLTGYVLRLSVSDVAHVTTRDALRLTPMSAAQVPAPPLGGSLFWDDGANALRIKLPDGTLRTVTLTTP